MGILTAISVRNAKPGRHGDGSGLYLLVRPSGARSWVLRIQRHGKRRDIGLGSIAALNLAEAREKAAELRKHALNGRDPITERDRDRGPIPTFREAARAAHNDLKSGWTPKYAAAFLSTLEDHAFGLLGSRRIDMIDAALVRDMLAPIWTRIPCTARKLRQRVGTVLNYAYSKGWREHEAPLKSVTLGLARQASAGNFAAMPYSEVPKFVATIVNKPATTGRDALMFLLLTAARSGEVRTVRWSHIDLESATWNRPADLMKNRLAHTVTLNQQAVDLLRRKFAHASPDPGDLIFPARDGKTLSDMTLTKVLKDAKVPFTVHGFRSSFRDWAAETMPKIPDPVAEAALAHVVSDKVIAAYKRTTFLALRRQLLDAWGCALLRQVAD
ncbi:integrase arm-type DNA-binding domain-containing protein [Sphingomonas sp. ZT3P38]|uniref:tyrosine-type recombinase/integrase n=1 Tax=Parasphingomonas zepuensis TaxID=3096161 RepID=UPI002FC7F937